jgi:hypothetical protein
MKIFHRTILVQTFLLLVSGVAFAGTDPLPSWNKGAAKTTDLLSVSVEAVKLKKFSSIIPILSANGLMTTHPILGS